MDWPDAHMPLLTELAPAACVETIDRTPLTGLGRQTALVKESHWNRGGALLLRSPLFDQLLHRPRPGVGEHLQELRLGQHQRTQRLRDGQHDLPMDHALEQNPPRRLQPAIHRDLATAQAQSLLQVNPTLRLSWQYSQ